MGFGNHDPSSPFLSILGTPLLLDNISNSQSYRTCSSPSKKLCIKHSRSNALKTSFSYLGAKVWNEIPCVLKRLNKKKLKTSMNCFCYCLKRKFTLKYILYIIQSLSVNIKIQVQVQFVYHIQKLLVLNTMLWKCTECTWRGSS